MKKFHRGMLLLLVVWVVAMMWLWVQFIQWAAS